ncbi:hematopoietic prostaglandin D synthase-like [Penaeus japonicus]|uniref:hematopoietic prostaglandin D synthase-like n=1 Tax=Penaeus japonicus TaxID=27405 RepID=UPI001C717345|nr:hematopoietic prostaglandin D synthase-like [Penaeus japonicus]
MPEYKLIYFNAMGRAEMVRWLFAYGGVAYTDERIEREDWPEKKKSLPFPKVPLLMVDGKPLPQSLAMARYAAKEVGLVPEDNLQAAYCDALADTISEMMGAMYQIMMSDKDEEEKRRQFKEEFYPNVMEPVMTRLEKRLSDKEWFIGDKISWSDLMISLAFGNVKAKKPEIFQKFPTLSAHVDKVRELPKIKEWISKRPVTAF